MTDATDITHLVPEARLGPYRRAVAQAEGDVDLASFYDWCQQLSLALFADIATLEVAMRSAVARELVQIYGVRWYARAELFDDDCARQISTAWRHGGLQALKEGGTPDAVLEGKLVAALMFGFWVNLLGRGSWAGKSPLRTRRIYDTSIWKPALSRAFPAAPSRRETEQLAYTVRAARNRIAHHEHIVWGVPVPGTGDRLSVVEAHDAVLGLAGFISPETQGWIHARSRLRALIRACPVEKSHLRLTV